MAITFTQAPTVAADGRPTSGDFNKLAAAFNDRMRSGLGDPTWRVWWKAWSMFRALIAPDGDLTPAEDEWFKLWMHVPPEDGFSSNAPTPTHPWTRWAAGDDGLDPEDVRVNHVPSSPDDSATVAWENGKAQRGYTDPATGLHAAPAFEASVAHYNIYSWALINANGDSPDHSGDVADAAAQNKTGYKFFKTFGGYASSPTHVDCGGEESAVRRFVNLRDSSVAEYSTCPDGDTIELAQIEYGASQYILYGATKVLDDPEDPESGFHWVTAVSARLPYHTWLEGPYTGDTWLQKQNGWQWNEVLCRYLQGFRGSTAQRASDSFRIRSVGFDFQKFFGTQYRLAPAYAKDTDGDLDAQYPKAQFDGPIGDGVAADFVAGVSDLIEGGNSFHFETIDRFGMAGYRVHAEGLAEPVRLILTDTNLVEADISLTVENGDEVVWLDAVKRPWLTVFTAPGQSIPEGATIWIEFAHLESYRPDLADAYVVLRRGTTAGGAGACDTQGEEFSNCVSFGRSYFERGHIYCTEDVPAVDETALNATPVYEAARKMLRDRLRFLDRDNLVSYSVDSGKSVLVFDRFLSFGGNTYDLFEGIAPPNAAIESGKILAGVDYKVRGSSGTVTYNGTEYEIDDTFTGVVDVGDYTVSEGGDAAPWQVNGIITTAPQKGRANEWLMFMSFCPYGGSGYEDDDYNDVYGFLMNRCMINSPRLHPAADPDMAEHFCSNLSGDLCVKPEAPSGFNYSAGMNAAASSDFFSSCPVFPPDYEIEKAQMDYDADRVTLTFKTQFRNGGDFRTDENGLTDYLAIGEDGECPTRTGDVAVLAADSPTHGACKPRFYFTKLAPKVYEDEDNVQQTHDTRLIADEMLWLNFQLDAMCEGYLDPTTPAEQCKRQSCYLFANLCYQALGHRWFRLLPGRLFDEFHQGFGAMPNIKLYRETFNDLSACVNLLTTLALELPKTVEFRTKQTFGRADLGPSLHAGSTEKSGKIDSVAHDDLVFEGVEDGDWSDWTVIDEFGAGIAQCAFDCGGSGAASSPYFSTIDGRDHYGGIEHVIYPAGGGTGSDWHPEGENDPEILSSKTRVQLRVTVAGIAAMGPDILALLDASGAVQVAFADTGSWWTHTTSGEPTCGEFMTDWGFPDNNFETHSFNGARCMGVPFGSEASGEPLDVEALKLGDPDTHIFALGKWFENPAFCTWGANSFSYVTGIGYFTFSVPLV